MAWGAAKRFDGVALSLLLLLPPNGLVVLLLLLVVLALAIPVEAPNGLLVEALGAAVAGAGVPLDAKGLEVVGMGTVVAPAANGFTPVANRFVEAACAPSGS